jgi:hypothetical protein
LRIADQYLERAPPDQRRLTLIRIEAAKDLGLEE